MDPVKLENFLKANEEVLIKIRKRTCTICKLIPSLFPSDSNDIYKGYCQKCANLNQITGDLFNLEMDKKILSDNSVYNYVNRNTDKIYEDSFNKSISKNSTHIYRKKSQSDGFLNSKTRILKSQKLIRVKLNSINLKNEQRFKILERDYKKLNSQVNHIIEKVKDINIKDNESITKQGMSDHIDFENEKNSFQISPKAIKLRDDSKLRNENFDESKLKLIYKFSEFTSILDDISSQVFDLKSESLKLKDNFDGLNQDLNEKINLYKSDCENKINEINSKFQATLHQENDFYNKIICSIENMKNTVTYYKNKNNFKSHFISRLNFKVNNLKSYFEKSKNEKFVTLIKSDTLVPFEETFPLESLKLVDDPENFLTQNDVLNNKLDQYLENKIIYSNVTHVISKAHSQYIESMVMKEKNTLISCSKDGSIKVWNLKTGQMEKEIMNAHNGESIHSLLIYKENNLLISGGFDSNIRFWDNNYNQLDFINNGSSIYHMIRSNNVLIVASIQKTVNFYDINSKILLNTIKTCHNDSIRKCLLLKTDDTLLTASDDSLIKVWGIRGYSNQNSLNNTYYCQYTIKNHKDSICSLLELDNKIIVSTDRYGTIIFSSIEKGFELIKRYDILDYDKNARQNSRSYKMEAFELKKYKTLISVTCFSSLLIWDLNSLEILRNVKFGSLLHTLNGLENDEGVIFSQASSINKVNNIIIFK